MTKRCAHFFVLGKCPDKSCPHWDGLNNDSEAGRRSRPAVVKAKIRASKESADGKLLCDGCDRFKEPGEFNKQAAGRGYMRKCKTCACAVDRGQGALAGAAARAG